MRDAWLALTGVLAHAETEVQQRFYETLGVSPDANLGAELMARVKKNREEFERRIDEGVKAAVAKVRAPIDKEIASLKERVEKLQQKVEQRRSKGEEVAMFAPDLLEGQGHRRHRRRHRPRQVDGARFGELGAKLVSPAARRDVLDAAAAEMQAARPHRRAGRARRRARADQVDAMVKATVERFGRVDVLINNAAGNFLQMTEKLSPNALRHGHRHRLARHVPLHARRRQADDRAGHAAARSSPS